MSRHTSYICVSISGFDKNVKHHINGYHPEWNGSCEIYDWYQVSINQEYISDIIHMDDLAVVIKDDFEESFRSFVKGKILMVEKTTPLKLPKKDPSDVYSGTTFSYAMGFSSIRLSVSIVTMSNGNQYHILK